MRESRNLKYRATQTGCALLLGIKQGSISDWNKPEGGLKLAHAIKLATTLNICVEWIYTERGPKRPPPVDRNLARIYDKWNALTDITKGRILQIVDDEIATGQSAQVKADADSEETELA